MTALLPILREFEEMGRSGDLAAAGRCRARLDAALADTREFLVQHLPPTQATVASVPEPPLSTV
jgi:hypothetical protein